MIRTALALAICAAAVQADDAPNLARTSPPAAKVSVQRVCVCLGKYADGD